MAEAVAAQLGYVLLGAVIGEVLRSIKEVKDKTIRFKRQLQRLESTLTSVLPRLEKIRDSNIAITDTLKAEMDRLIAELNGAKKLILDCTYLRKRDVVKKVEISNVLKDVDERVVRFFQLDVQMEIWETTMRIGTRVEGVESLLGKVDRKMKKLMIVGVGAALVGGVALYDRHRRKKKARAEETV